MNVRSRYTDGVKTVTFLVDCNNFFVSCERVFRPDLEGKPVVVLSSNDGCVVARSNEVKVLGIPMGVPYFKVRDELQRHQVTVFSSNFKLYGDMSDRVMTVLSEFCDGVDQYSIDEAFLTFALKEPIDFAEHGHTLRCAIKQRIGLPVSVGIAPTKTLAKVASEKAKKGGGQKEGVCSLLDPDDRLRALQDFPAGEVWNIGRKHSARLVGIGVTTAKQFIELPEHWVKKYMGIGGRRTQEELRGQACYVGDEGVPKTRKAIMTSRSFSEATTDIAVVKEALAHHVEGVACKLRAQHSKVTALSAYGFVKERGDSYQQKHGGWYEFECPTNDTRQLLKASWHLAEGWYRPHLRYVKVGVLLSGLVPEASTHMTTLFGETDDQDNERFMHALDAINKKCGAGSVRLAASLATSRGWGARHERRSPAYTTRWSDILSVV